MWPPPVAFILRDARCAASSGMRFKRYDSRTPLVVFLAQASLSTAFDFWGIAYDQNCDRGDDAYRRGIYPRQRANQKEREAAGARHAERSPFHASGPGEKSVQHRRWEERLYRLAPTIRRTLLKRVSAHTGGRQMKLILFVGSVGFLCASPSSAQTYPPQCTTQYSYSAACCASSYGRNAEGTIDNGKRHAELAACTAKTKADKK